MATALSRAPDRPLLNLGLVGLTLCTVLITFRYMFGGGTGTSEAARWMGSLVFAISVLAVLGCHEMGHYLLARWHRVDTSLPYFIPLPMLGFGTLGAVIRIRGRIPNRNALVDIGAAGPLAGLVVALPLIFWGLTQSTLVDAPPVQSAFPGETSLWALGGEVIAWIRRDFIFAPEDPFATRVDLIFGDNLFMVGLQWLVFGALPAGKEVLVHPTVIAGWFGLLVTMLNLMPIGQLDGGHLTYAMFGRGAQRIGKIVAFGLLLMCLFISAGWLVWLVVTAKVIGFKHPEVVDRQEPLTPLRRWICIACFVALVLCIMPVPISQVVR